MSWASWMAWSIGSMPGLCYFPLAVKCAPGPSTLEASLRGHEYIYPTLHWPALGHSSDSSVIISMIPQQQLP